MTTLLTRDEFLAPSKRRHRNVSLPVRGGDVRIQSLFEHEKEAYEATLLNSEGEMSLKGLRGARRRLICLCLVDADGERLLSDADVNTLKHLDGADIAALQDACQEWVGFKSGDIESLVKNSEAVTADS